MPNQSPQSNIQTDPSHKPAASKQPGLCCLGLDNGLQVAVESMPGCQTVCLTLWVPCGFAHEPNHQPGVAALAEELVFRGCADLSSRAYSDALDRLGIQRQTNLESRYLQINFVCLGQHLTQAMQLLADLVLKPQWPSQELPPAVALCQQAIASLADEPEERVGLLLRKHLHPAPFNRSPYGQLKTLGQLTTQDVQAFWNHCCKPKGSFLSIAGAVDPKTCLDHAAQTFAHWHGQRDEPTAQANAQAQLSNIGHEQETSEQTHLLLAYDAPSELDPTSLAYRLGVACLSGGSSGRLFTQVREKRGLCYAVWAGYAGDKEKGWLSIYAGSAPDRAQQTLTVIEDELRLARQGVDEQEFLRAKAGFKSRLVMQGESTESRAISNARDLTIHQRLRSLTELSQQVQDLTFKEVNTALQTIATSKPTLATVGPAPLTLQDIR